jgi:hypothetical protein
MPSPPGRLDFLPLKHAFLTVNCRDVERGERVLVEGPGWVEIRAHADTEVLLFDLD